MIFLFIPLQCEWPGHGMNGWGIVIACKERRDEHKIIYGSIGHARIYFVNRPLPLSSLKGTWNIFDLKIPNMYIHSNSVIIGRSKSLPTERDNKKITTRPFKLSERGVILKKSQRWMKLTCKAKENEMNESHMPHAPPSSKRCVPWFILFEIGYGEIKRGFIIQKMKKNKKMNRDTRHMDIDRIYWITDQFCGFCEYI